MKNKQNVVIILPTYNEAGDIEAMLGAILSQQNLLPKYNLSVLVVDDTSPDGTGNLVKKFAKKHKYITLLTGQKEGFGKAYVRGFEYALDTLQADIVFQMDADFSHNPSDIPRFLKALENGADVTIGSRYVKGGSVPTHWTLTRRLNSVSGNFLARFLGGIKAKDCTGGFRAIRATSLAQIDFNRLEVSGYVFQIALLQELCKIGSRIREIPIRFTDRTQGESKLSKSDQLEFLRYIFIHQMRQSRLGKKILGELAFPISPLFKSTMRGAGILYEKKEYITHTTLPHRHSAMKTLTVFQKAIVFLLLGLLAYGLLQNWHAVLVGLFSFLIILYFADLLFSVVLVFRSFLTFPEVFVSKKDLERKKDASLPTFSVLCPLYKEAPILPQFVEAMSKLSYPKKKLEVLLLFEEDDLETIDVARRMDLPEFIKIVLVPESFPRTKPKALNYGLAHSKGDYIVIYDAEDIPEPDQLKKAVIAFDKSGRNIFCLQAKLNFYNPHQNLLTRLFTAEYSTWFDLILTGLYSLNAPIPLGGTSNFFRRRDIVDVGAWDAFNVCEDCDLGMRLFKKGYRTALFNSTTYEEANSNLPSWVRQRSHWIKGYIQGFFVHIRSPRGFMVSLREPHLFTFLLVVGGKTLSVFINPLLWALTISYFVFRPLTGDFIESLYPTNVFYMGVVTLFLGNLFYLYNYMLGCAKRGYWDLLSYAWFIPIYWLMMSFAAWKAVYQIFVKPHYWEKTTHGLHLVKS